MLEDTAHATRMGKDCGEGKFVLKFEQCVVGRKASVDKKVCAASHQYLFPRCCIWNKDNSDTVERQLREEGRKDTLIAKGKESGDGVAEKKLRGHDISPQTSYGTPSSEKLSCGMNLSQEVEVWIP